MKPPKTRTDGHGLGWFAVYVQSLAAQMALAVELVGVNLEFHGSSTLGAESVYLFGWARTCSSDKGKVCIGLVSAFRALEEQRTKVKSTQSMVQIPLIKNLIIYSCVPSSSLITRF